jgi:alpha-galactosidase
VRRTRLALALAVAIAGASLPPAPTRAETVVRVGSATIENDPDAGTWTIQSAGTALTLALDARRDFQVLKLASYSGESRILGAAPDTQLTVAGRTFPFGSRGAGFVFQNVATSVDGARVRLDATFDVPTLRLRATRHYAAASGSPTFETWTTYTPLRGAVPLSDLNAFTFTVSAGPVSWVNGLQGESADTIRDAAFAVQQRMLNTGERMTIGAAGRASEQVVPWFAIESGADVFYGGLLWSGAWSLSASRSDAGIDLMLGLPQMSTTISAAIDGPHAFYGVTRGKAGDASAALRVFAAQGLRGGRPFPALVTYNTWYTYGVKIDEASMRAEIEGASKLGAELFVVDAGWYTGAGRDGAGDFTSGLGTWQPDPARFPAGLRALSDYAHDRGMKFGLWVEPERVALSTVGRPGLAQDGWLAKTDGKFGDSDAAQICFASAAARRWVLDRLTSLIDAVQPDYLKWDNNFWINCNRSGHGHGSADGNFAHVNGLYEVLSTLRDRYPDMLIENVSGGGNRMDLGMLRYSDAGWMDDRTTPSIKVRHNIEGLGMVFPPSYLLSFVMPDSGERLHDPADLRLIFRSRMMGVLGLCFRTGEYDEDETTEMAKRIAEYKSLRGTAARSAGRLLTAQAGSPDRPAWDAWQTTTDDRRHGVIWAFQSDRGVRGIAVKAGGLRARGIYDVRTFDRGQLGALSGADLMEDGVPIVALPDTDAHVVVLTLREGAAAPAAASAYGLFRYATPSLSHFGAGASLR